jgi:hypothetical protein
MPADRSSLPRIGPVVRGHDTVCEFSDSACGTRFVLVFDPVDGLRSIAHDPVPALDERPWAISRVKGLCETTLLGTSAVAYVGGLIGGLASRRRRTFWGSAMLAGCVFVILGGLLPDLLRSHAEGTAFGALILGAGTVVAVVIIVWGRCSPADDSGSITDVCANCGYDLRASPDRCPECGTPTTSTPA